MNKQGLSYLLIFSLVSTICIAQSYPKLIKIKGGTFSMGDELNTGDSVERPVHMVKINSFRMAETETTVLQWKKFCEETGRTMPNAPDYQSVITGFRVVEAN